jgi:hypothetical protein
MDVVIRDVFSKEASKSKLFRRQFGVIGIDSPYRELAKDE